MTAEDEVVREYLAILAATEKLRATPPGFVYAGLGDFLQRHGRFWTPGPRPKGFRAMTPKYCFDNAYRVVTDARHRRRDLRYVEGIALSVIPVHHAWVVDEAGTVIDPTWPTPGGSYFGVPFLRSTVFAVRSAQSVSVLDNWAGPRRHAIYREPFKEENA
jgi:hypothetical protein